MSSYPLPIPMKKEPLPVRTGQLVKAEPKKEPTLQDNIDKRPLADSNSKSNTSAKHVKSGPNIAASKTITKKVRARTRRSQRPRVAKEKQSLPQNVPNGNPPRRSQRLRVSASNVKSTAVTAPDPKSNREKPKATKPKSSKLSRSRYRHANIQKPSLSEKKKVARDRASIVLNGDLALPTVPAPPPPPFVPSPSHAADPVPVPVPVTSASTSKCSPESTVECVVILDSTPPSPQTPNCTESSAEQSTSAKAVAESNEDIDILELLCQTYGLVVVERNPKTKEAEWVACKFCPIFGCKKRNRRYIMVYNKPFNKDKIKGHLTAEHPTIWPKYHNASNEDKTKMFEGKRLPGRRVFQERVTELKCSWGILEKEWQMSRSQKRKEAREELEDLYYGMRDERKKLVDKSEIILRSGTTLRPMEIKATDVEKAWTENDPLTQKRFAKEMRDEAEALLQDDAVILSESRVLRSGKETNVQKKAVNLWETYGTCEIDWKGRNEFRIETAQLSGKKMFSYGDARLKNKVIKKLNDPVWGTRNSLPYLWLPTEIRDVILNGVLSEDSRCISKNGLFFHPEKYLLEQEATGKQKYDDSSRGFAWNELLFVIVLTYLNRGLSIYTAEELLEPMLKNAVPKWVQDEESMGDMVWRIGNSICAESLRLLRKVLKSDHNWLLLPTFAPCEVMGESGVEVFIPVLYDEFELYFYHLISVRDGENVGDRVISVLQAVCGDWERKIGGFYSHISKEDQCRKAVEETIMQRLGERAQFYPLRKFEKGQKEVQEVAVGQLCEMNSESVMAMVSMFMPSFLASRGGETEVDVRESIRKEHNGLVSGELILSKHKKRKHSSLKWKMTRDRLNRNLAKYVCGLQVIWRQEVRGLRSALEHVRGGFLDRQTAVARCGIVKDWRCDSVVDATLERTAHARNVGKLRRMMGIPMKFECTNNKHRLHTFEAAHMFDANWSNMKGRAFNN